MIDWSRWGLPQDPEERERIWAEQFHQHRKQMVQYVEQALGVKDPVKRKALYQRWREELGDDRARSYAKYAEGCIAGRVKIAPIKNMVNAVEGLPLVKLDY